MYDSEEQISPSYLIDSLSRFKKDTVENLLKSTTEQAAVDEKERRDRLEKWKEMLREKLGQEPTNPQSLDGFKPQQLEEMRMAAERSRADVENLRTTAQKKPKDLLQEYKQMIYDQKKGVHHSINRFLQGFMYGYQGGDSKVAPKIIDWYNKNQELLAQGKTGEDRAINNYEGKVNQSYDLMNKYQVAYDKFNEQRKQFLIKQLAEAEKDPQAAQFAKQELERMKIGDNEIKAGVELYLKSAGNPMTQSQVLTDEQKQQGINNIQQQAQAKGMGAAIPKWLFADNPATPGGIGQNGIQYVPDVNAAGQKVLNAIPRIGHTPGNPKSPATFGQIQDKSKQLLGLGIPGVNNGPIPGINTGAIPGINTSQPQGIQSQGMQPQGAQPSQPQPSPLQPQVQKPQANVSPANRVVDTFLAKKNGNPLLVTDDDIKKAPQLYSTPIQGEQYIIVKNQTPLNQASQAAAGRFGAPAQIVLGQPGEKTAAGKTSAEMKSNFISKTSDVITALTDAAKEPSKIPGKSVAEATLGGPGNDPKGFLSGMFNNDTPNRLPVVSDVAKKIAQLIHTNAFANKSAEQTTSSIASEFNVLLDLYKNDPKAKEFVTRYTQNISQLLSFYTKSITGSQVNQTELQQFAQVIPNLFTDPQTAVRQLVDFSTKVSIGQELKSANYSEDQIARVMKNPAFTQFLQEESNKYANDMVRQGKMTSARPGVKNPPVDKNSLLPVNLLGKFMDKYGPDALGGISVKRRTQLGGQLNPQPTPSPQEDKKKKFKDALNNYVLGQ